MLNLFEEQLLDDVVSRVEQSRFSYYSHTEEFHNLNTNFQTYLNDSKRIDDENRQLQNNIEQIRTNYFVTLENHVKRLPEDFRQESHILTEADLERYKSKSRAKRFINEREELKKRINFISNNDKEQTKRLNNLQKQERFVHNEFKNLNEQIQNLYKYVEREKQTHRQAMDKVDQLQIQLEQSSIERSKTEFEIQTLREEVQLMKTAKEFLDDEYQAIVSTHTEANEYLLLTLNESISRIRDDFDELNKTQLKEIENEYKQMMKILEENSLNNANIDNTAINHQRTIQNECEKFQDEYQSIAQELTTLNDHNHILSERVLAMEADLYTIRDERMRELTIKDNELECSRIELQTLNEKLSYLSEYDRNLKFELTLYRGVLESEWRRKQQQLNNKQQPLRPTTLRTTTTRNNKNYPVFTTRNQLESIVEQTNAQLDETISKTKHPEDEKIENKQKLNHQESLSPELKKSFNENEKTESTIVASQEEHQISKEIPESPISTVPPDEESSLEVQLVPDLASPLEDHHSSSETSKFPTSPTASTHLKDEPTSFDAPQSPTTSSKIQTLISTPVISSSVHQSPSTLAEDRQTSTDTQKLSSILPSTNSEMLPEPQETSTTPAISEEQHESSEILQLTSTQLEDQQKSPEVLQTPSTLIEDQLESSELHRPLVMAQEEVITSPMDEQTPSATQKSPISPTSTASPTDLSNASEAHQSLSNNHQTTSDVQQSTSDPTNYHSIPSESSGTPSKEDRSILSDVPQKVSTPSQEQSARQELQQSPMADENIQDQSTSVTADEYRPASLIEEVDGENQLPGSSEAYGDSVELEDSPAIEEHETNQTEKEESSSFDLSKPLLEKTINPSENNESILLEEDIIKTEEQINSSDQNETEEDGKIGYLSSSGYYGTLNDSTHLTYHELNKTSLKDVEDDGVDLVGEVDISTSPKIEEKEMDDNNETNLAAVMQDLRYVYRDLANEEDLVDIDDDFPNNLVDRLEFGDNIIRTLFDSLLRKYIVQPAEFQIRSKTMDWIEFRDILFPILTGRYMERHIRKFFDLFDTIKDGYLSLQEITELLELLQVSNATELAQYMINEFDKNQDGKLNVDEFIDAVKRADDVNDNILPEKIEYNHWYIQHPLDEEDNDIQSISLEVPLGNFALKTNSNNPEIIANRMILLGRIFKKVGADVENKRLDSNKPTLSMRLTNEFIHNNILVSNDDLHLFIDIFLNKKQNSDCFIDWIEFRDIFLPFVNDGMFSKDDITRWFHILDTHYNRRITQQQILLLLRLLQIPKPETILDKMNEISETYTNNNGSWTLEELLFALEQIDETTTRLLPANEQIQSFDREWLTKNIY